jgi:hypothetical protein
VAEDDLRAQKLVRTSPPDTLKNKDALTNGFVHGMFFFYLILSDFSSTPFAVYIG